MKSSTLYMMLGILLCCLVMIPYLLLGTGSIITYHDQLDGELFSYLLTAKYLFTDIRIYPELLGGLPANGAIPPAPLFVLLYVWLPAFQAFLCSQFIIYLISFIGMFLLLQRLIGTNLISFGIAVTFMLLPFYPVYGLCIPGQPLMLYGVLCLLEKNASSAPLWKKGVFYGLVFLYGLGSSLVLVGFVWLGIFALAILTLLILGNKYPRAYIPTLGALFGTLFGSYLITNLSLILQILFPSTAYVSHKTELFISPQNIGFSILDALKSGISYAQSYHMIILISTIFCLILLFVDKASEKTPILCLVFGILFLCIFYGLYLGPQVTELRNQFGGILKELNLARVAWILPVLWCLLAAYVLSYLQKRLTLLVPLCILAIWGGTVLLHSSLKPNLAKLVKGDSYYALDWDRFFAEDIFVQIKDAIPHPQESYRVVSVGIYPAAATYNGFYCLDGYSNNYPLEYKHRFRQVIAGELEKSDYVRDFYDHWGNRCYITTAEQANYYTFEKKWNSVIYDLDLNIEVLKEMNCKYIFSAAYLMNAEEMGLTLLQDAPFETENSWYHIYVYQL